MAADPFRWRPPEPAPIDSTDFSNTLDDRVADWPDWWPPLDRRANLEWRARIITHCDRDTTAAGRIRKICADEPLFWAAGFAAVFEPRLAAVGRPATIPFIPFGFQARLIDRMVESIRDRHDLTIVKSRDLGATWIFLMIMLHHWMFRPGFAALVASEKEKLVDERGNMSTSFEKLRFMLYRQPQFLKPAGFDRDQHDKNLILHNPEMNSSIAGSATTSNVGRSGRYAVVAVDEYAAIPSGKQVEIESSTSDAAFTRWFISTPRGPANQFARKARQHHANRIDLHWSEHPVKGMRAWCELGWNEQAGRFLPGKVRSPWYDYETLVKRKEQAPWQHAQELDLDFSGSAETLFDSVVLKHWRDTSDEPLDESLHRHRPDGAPALIVWERYRDGIEYLVSLDPHGGSEGGVGSGAAIHVWRLPEFVQVAEYQGWPGLDMLPSLLYHLGRRYGWAALAIESNIGKAAINDLMAGHIDREGLEGSAGSILNQYPHDRIMKHIGVDGKETDRYGIHTNATTKPHMVWTLAEPMIRRQEMTVRGHRTIDQLSGFRQAGAKLHNPDGDDLVLSMLVGVYAWRYAWRPSAAGSLPFAVS